MNDYAKQTQSNPIFTKNPEKLAHLVRKLALILLSNDKRF